MSSFSRRRKERAASTSAERVKGEVRQGSCKWRSRLRDAGSEFEPRCPLHIARGHPIWMSSFSRRRKERAASTSAERVKGEVRQGSCKWRSRLRDAGSEFEPRCPLHIARGHPIWMSSFSRRRKERAASTSAERVKGEVRQGSCKWRSRLRDAGSEFEPRCPLHIARGHPIWMSSFLRRRKERAASTGAERVKEKRRRHRALKTPAEAVSMASAGIDVMPAADGSFPAPDRSEAKKSAPSRRL